MYIENITGWLDNKGSPFVSARAADGSAAVARRPPETRCGSPAFRPTPARVARLCARPQGAASQSVMCLMVTFLAILPGLPHYLIVAACTDGFLRLSCPSEHQLLAKLRKHQKLTRSPALRWAFWPVAPAAAGPYPAFVVRHRLAQQLHQVASNLPGPRGRRARQRLLGGG